MSGTSLDGIDLAACTFSKIRGKWQYQIERAKTIPYNKAWKSALSTAHLISGEALMSLHTTYGKYLGLQVKKFIKDYRIKSVDFISSHGHTIFHQPGNGFTFQLGDGGAIHAACGLPVVYDFRNLDVQFGGEGAPLVPIGDRLLFYDYDVCVNLGGIANLSFEKSGKRLAWDICFVNMALNMLAAEAGKSFDRDGSIASSGKVQDSLLKLLQSADRSIRTQHRSLAREHFENGIEQLITSKVWSLEDRLRTMTEFIGIKVGTAIRKSRAHKILVTGGGAHNSLLLKLIISNSGHSRYFVKADNQLIDYKEALIFAFLGVLNVKGEYTSLSSVTGARKDNCTGLKVGFPGIVR
jgi:anhydro-N-acetylmuramic acid kinase